MGYFTILVFSILLMIYKLQCEDLLNFCNCRPKLIFFYKTTYISNCYCYKLLQKVSKRYITQFTCALHAWYSAKAKVWIYFSTLCTWSHLWHIQESVFAMGGGGELREWYLPFHWYKGFLCKRVTLLIFNNTNSQMEFLISSILILCKDLKKNRAIIPRRFNF